MSTHPLAWLAALEGVPSGLAAARDGIDVVLRDRGLRRTAPETTAESLLLGAHASAVLEGSTATLEEVRAGAGDEVARDAVELSTELLGLVPVLRTAPLQALARVHTLAARRSQEPDRLGRPRDAHAAGHLQELARLLGADGEVSALLLAAVLHAEIATAAPFPSHNGLVARGVERLVLVARGVDPTSLVVPEVAHLALRPAYESNLRGYATGGDAGAHAWALYAGEAFAAGADASPARR